MTSTNVFTGMMSARNSSRVLRPPGGGHTDILGLTSEPQAAPVRKNNPRNISSITEGTNCNDFNQSTVTVEKSATVTVEKPASLPVEKPASLPVEKSASLPVEKPATVTVEETVVSTSNEKSAPRVDVPLKANEPAPKELPSSNQASRVRVPPGGFSSGLW